ncbi:MAG: penicillin-binding protein 2 [Sphingomonadales bacterium]
MKLDRLLGKRSLSEAQVQMSFTRRGFVLGAAQIGMSAVLAGRMAWLSIAENERYKLLAESNRVNLSLIPPRRGWVVDRTGKPLAINKTVFRADIIPDRLRDKDATLDMLVKLLNLPEEERQRISDDIDNAAGFQPVQIAENLDWEHYAALSVRAQDLPGVIPAQGFARFYPDGAAVGHLLGYVGSASAADYEKTKDPLMLTPGYKVGKDALEKTFDPILKGVPGARRSEVTARGKLVRELDTRTDIPGRTLQLTIDKGLQAYAARRLGTNSGSAVVLDCLTGELLAMVSMPAYDPNSFSDGISRKEWKSLSDNDHVPLMNKTLQGLYPPGSTVKPMNGLALLEAGVSPSDRIVCSGSLRVGNGIFHCHKRRGHGPLDLKQAIMYSCDIYFYEMIRRLGYDRIAPIARSVGLGQKFELPFSTQRYGTIPDSAWKKNKYKTDWTVADSLNASIGQGYVLANPLQLAVMSARIASGRALMPHLLHGKNSATAAALPYTAEHFAYIRDAMAGVVNGGGTGGASRLQIPGITLAAKTGTAQVRRITMAERAGGVLGNASLPFKLRDHALFVCFAPAEAPRYAAAIVLEHNGHTVRNLDTPLTGRDIMTYLFDPDLAMKNLAEVEPTWGGDIATRAAAESAALDVPVLPLLPASPPENASNATQEPID